MPLKMQKFNLNQQDPVEKKEREDQQKKTEEKWMIILKTKIQEFWYWINGQVNS